ncbi:hypothetical protein [Leptospira noguchii]|uniref:Lipoprotein n=1 Tax=Leptospira noguchii str. 2007001578 TaxID=1049974 RepID=A0ABP2TCI6_9LEPT|nr:hypothetical protein [Leptospira noguchii]EMN01477.1 hypothetical protein LEP1GSC035_4078 [Leptospira noguchii str. 2007001578]
MNNFYRQFISHITVVYVVVLSHDITGGATNAKRSCQIAKQRINTRARKVCKESGETGSQKSISL